MFFNMYSMCVKYQFKSASSLVHIFILLITIAAVIIPVAIINRTGGFWVTNWSRIEKPIVTFKYQYLLIAEGDEYERPIICSSFEYYKGSRILDDCTVLQVHETSKDGQKDALKFEARFFSDQAIKVNRVEMRFDAAATMDHSVIHSVQEIQMSGHLSLVQKGALESHYNYVYPSDKIHYNGHSLAPLPISDFTEMFSATITETRANWKSGFSQEEESVIKCEVFYDEQIIHYRLGVWEQYKWAWVQYSSLFIVFLYLAKCIVSFVLDRRFLDGHIEVPWKKMA